MDFEVKKKKRKIYTFKTHDLEWMVKVEALLTPGIKGKVLVNEVFESARGKFFSPKFADVVYRKMSKVITPIDKYIVSETELSNILKEASKQIERIIEKKDKENEIPQEKINNFLANPKIIDPSIEIIRNSRRNKKLVGQDPLVLLGFFGMLSAKTDYPVNLDATGPSSSGKTIIFTMVSNAFHDDDKMILGGGSKTSLKYDVDMQDEKGNYINDIDQKIILLLEKQESIQLIEMMKPILSHDKYEIAYSVSEKGGAGGILEDVDESSSRRTSNYVIRGFPCLVTMSVHNPSNSEQLTRELIASPDVSKEQIEKVCDEICSSAMRFPDEREVDERVPLLQYATKEIKRTCVMNPFFSLINDIIPKESCRIYRDLDKFKSLVEAVTLLHHKNRLEAVVGNERIYVSTLEDNIVAFSVIDKVFRASFIGVSELSMEVFSVLEEMSGKDKPLVVERIHEHCRANDLKMTKQELKGHLFSLEDKGMITYEWGRIRGSHKRSKKKQIYEISSDIKEFNQVAVLTPLILESFYYNIKNLYSDKKLLRLLSLSKLPENCEVNNSLKNWINRKLGGKISSEDLRKLSVITDIFYCIDQDSCIQKVLHEDTKKKFDRKRWWKSIRGEAIKDYNEHQEHINQMKELLQGSTDPDERERIIRAMEDKM